MKLQTQAALVTQNPRVCMTDSLARSSRGAGLFCFYNCTIDNRLIAAYIAIINNGS
jgi:hypothetical protein